MKIHVDAQSDIGLVRTNNEDMLSLSGILLRDRSMGLNLEVPEDGLFYLLVSDGMGGHENGEFASEYTLTSLREFFLAEDGLLEDLPDRLRSFVSGISERLNSLAEEHEQRLPQGCTLSGIVWKSGRCFLLNAGDSRVYRLRDGILRQLTTDDTESGISGDPDGDRRLLNCVGGGSPGHLSVEDISDRLIEGDILLICSDGLYDMVAEEDIESIVSARLEHPARRLVELANLRGGEDNVSVIVASRSTKIALDSSIERNQ